MIDVIMIAGTQTCRCAHLNNFQCFDPVGWAAGRESGL